MDDKNIYELFGTVQAIIHIPPATSALFPPFRQVHGMAWLKGWHSLPERRCLCKRTLPRFGFGHFAIGKHDGYPLGKGFAVCAVWWLDTGLFAVDKQPANVFHIRLKIRHGVSNRDVSLCRTQTG